MVKKDAEIRAFVLKTARSICDKSIVYQKSIFSLFVTTSVVFICKFTVKAEYSSARDKFATTVLTSDGTEGLQEK